MKLTDCFDRVFIVHLPHHELRKERLIRNLTETGIADPEKVQWVRAIYGDWCGVPGWFNAGGGAWGCLQSHLRIVQDAIMDGLTSYCVLEDDVVFHERSPEMLDRLMKYVPKDWGQIYFGGQHLKEPVPLDGNPSVYQCRNVNRTHAFALHQRAFRDFQMHIMNAPDYIGRKSWHIDHQLGIAHENRFWNTYAPAWWLAGQQDGDSSISGRNNPRFWWYSSLHSRKLPFVYIDADASPEVYSLLEGKVHFGNNLKSGTREDVGLDKCVNDPVALSIWLKMIAREALDRHLLPGIQHPLIHREDVLREWRAGLLPPTEPTLARNSGYSFSDSPESDPDFGEVITSLAG